MLFIKAITTATVALLSSSASASGQHLAAEQDVAVCGNPTLSAEYLDIMQAMDLQETSLDFHTNAEPEFEVPVYFHVIQPTNASEEWVNEDKLKEQLGVINKYFQQAKIQFKLEGINRTLSNQLSKLHYYPTTLQDCYRGPPKQEAV
jgi:hypothetical protein